MEKNENILKLEHALMEGILRSPHRIPQTLLEQWKSSTVIKIELTGAGFFVNYHVPSNVPTLTDNQNFTVGNIGAKIPGLKSGAGFVLFVRNGVISMLEGYSYDESWPDTVESFELFEIDGKEIDWDNVTETASNGDRG